MTAVPDLGSAVRRSRRFGRRLSSSASGVASAVAVAAAAAAMVLAPVVLGPVTPATADTDDFEFASFDADYFLERTPNGHATMTIVETLVAQFPDFDQNRGIVRAIPERYDDVPLSVDVLSVTDGDGNPVPYERSSDDGFARLALGTDEFVHGRQTYVIEYTVDDPVRAFADTGADELYWDTNGTGWAQPFARVSARFHVPAELAGALTGATACYRGVSGSAGGCGLDSVPAGGGVVLTVEEAGLSAGENVTVAIGFEAGTFTRPVPLTEAWWVTGLPLLLLAAGVAAMIAMILTRLTRWRDARGRGIIVPQYTAPGVDILLAGNIIGRKQNAMAAQFVDFAVRRMVQLEDRGTGVAGDERYALRLRDAEGATDDEAKVLRALFGKRPEPGAGKVLGRLSSRSRSLLAGLADPRDRSRESGLRRTTPAGPAKALRRVAGGAALALTVLGVFAVFAEALHPLLVVEILAAWVAWAVTAGFSARRDALTDAGAELRDHLLGMRDYLALAEEDRYRMLQSPDGALRIDAGATDIVRLYERLLPYAVLWGVEDQWVEALQARYAETGTDNDWLVSRSPLASLDLRGFAASASSASTPVPTPSSGSSYSGSGTSSSFGGSSGGGFSGGGGGGGGGGGR